LQDVEVIKASMLRKAWDTTAMIAWLQEETKKVVDTKDEIFNKWVSLKSDDIKKFSTEAVVDKKKICDELSTQIVELFKKFVKDVLAEFKNKT
jgi:hypothetical protein